MTQQTSKGYIVRLCLKTNMAGVEAHAYNPGTQETDWIFCEFRAAWSVITASSRLGLHGETLFQNKRHTPKAVRADFKGGLEDGKQAEDTREDQTAWLPVLQLTAVSSHGSVLPYGCGLSMSKPGTVAAGGTSPNTPSSCGRCVALLPTSRELWSCSVEPRTSRSQNSSRKGQTNIQPHQKKGRERN